MNRGLLFLLILLSGASAHARIAKIRWEAVPNALRYEIKIQQGPETIVSSVTEGGSPQWRGALSPGYFTYQIRAIDKGELAGEWTKAQLILVKPKEVQTLGPGQNALVRLTEKEGRLFLKWRPMGKRVRYLIDIKTEGGSVQRTVVEKGEYEMEVPVSGEYRWRVTPQIQAEGSVDAGVLGSFEKSSLGETSSWAEFSLELDASYLKAKQRFHPPVIAPIPAKLPVPYGRKVAINWNSVESAEAYEVRYSVLAKGAGAVSSEDKKVTTVVVRSSEFFLPVQNGSRYEVSVRALSHINKRGLASIVSQDAKTQFEIDDRAAAPRPPVYVFLRTSVAPYRDARVVPSQSYSGTIDGGGVGFDFGIHFPWSSTLESELSLLQEMQEVDTGNDARGELKLVSYYVWHVGGHERGLRAKVGLGLGYLSYTLLSPIIASGTASVSGTSRSHISTLAAIPAFEVEQQISDDITLGLNLKLPIGMKSFADSSVSGVNTPVSSNYRLMGTFRWNLGGDFLVELFAGVEKRGINYYLNGLSGESSEISATRGGLGLNYRW